MTTEPELLGDEPVRGARHDGEPEPEPEVLDGAPPWSPPHWLRWVVAVVLVVGVVAWYADGRVRAHESAQVSTCERRLDVASTMSEMRMGAMANYLRPAIWSTHGIQQLHIADLMAGPARRVLPRAQRADSFCRAVSVRPWHFSLVARRNAATAYSGALVTMLRTIAARGRAYFHDDHTLTELRKAAGLDQALD